MLQYNPSITGSLTITGSLIVSGNISSSGSITISGSVASASYAENANLLDNLDSTSFATTTSFNALSSSVVQNSASLSTRLTTDESNYTSLSSSFATTSGSISGRVTTIEGQYATTGSNTFSNLQYISSSTNAQGFTTSASLYTDGGLRVGKDSFVSGTAYFNNVVVYGTSSIQYITSSQVNVGANIINLNTQTPAVRFGGMAVADSGSNAGVTGSMLWDSVYNRWIYSNPSGSNYDGGMIISGPRNTSGLGNELGTTACYLMAGQGDDHITSSAIYTDTNATCFYGGTSNITSTGGMGLCDNLGYSTGVNSWYINTGINGAVLRLKANGAYAGYSCRSGALGWADNAGAKTDILGWDDNCITALKPVVSCGNILMNTTTGAGVGQNEITINTAGTAALNVMVNNTLTAYQYANGSSAVYATATNIPMLFLTCGCERMRVLSGGDVLIGTSTASHYNSRALVVYGSSNAGLVLKTSFTCTGINDGVNIGLISDNSLRITNYETDGVIRLETQDTERMRITNTGITTFTCQVCSPSFNSTSTSTLNGLVVSCTANSNCFTGITVVNFAGGGSDASRAGIAFQAYDWVQSAIWHGRNTAAAYAGALLFGTNPSTANLTVGGVCTRLKIDNEGIACFACRVCTPNLSVAGTIQTAAFVGTFYGSTCTVSNVAISDTGIGIPNNATYLVSFTGNPAAAGGVYSWNEVGYLVVNSQYNGSSNTQMITYTKAGGGGTSVYPGALTLYPYFLIGGVEYTQTTSYGPSGQIRLKFCGWSNSPGSSLGIYLTQLM